MDSTSRPQRSPVQRAYAFIGSPRTPQPAGASPAVSRLLTASVSSALVNGSRVSPTAVTISRVEEENETDSVASSSSSSSKTESSSKPSTTFTTGAEPSIAALDARLAALRRSDAVAFALGEAYAEREALLRHVRLAIEAPERLSTEKARLAGVIAELVKNAPDVLRNATECRVLWERLAGLATLLQEPTTLVEKLERARAQVAELEERHPTLVGLVRAVQTQHRLLEACYLHLNDPARLDAQLGSVAVELSVLRRERPALYRRCLELHRSRAILEEADATTTKTAKTTATTMSPTGFPTSPVASLGVSLGVADAELENTVALLASGSEGLGALRERQRTLRQRLVALKARHPAAAALLDRRNRLQAEILALNEAVDDPDAVEKRLAALEATRDALRRRCPEAVADLAKRLYRMREEEERDEMDEMEGEMDGETCNICEIDEIDEERTSPMPGDVITDVRRYTVGDERDRLRLSGSGSPRVGRRELERLFSAELQRAVQALVSPRREKRRR